MKKGFYLDPIGVLFILGEGFYPDHYHVILEAQDGSILENKHVRITGMERRGTPLPHFRNIMFPTQNELDVLQMVEPELYRQVESILKYVKEKSE